MGLDSAHLFWTKFGMDVLVDPRHKPVEEFFIFLKIKYGRWWPPLWQNTKSAIT